MISNTTVIPFLKEYIDCSTFIVVDYEGNILYSDQCVEIENERRRIGNRVFSRVDSPNQSFVDMDETNSVQKRMDLDRSAVLVDNNSRQDCSNPIEMIDNSCFAVYTSKYFSLNV